MGGEAGQDMSLEQSWHVSIETLRAATSRHCHTDSVSGDTYHGDPIPHTYHYQLKGRGGVREQKHIANRKDTQSKLYVLTQPVSKTCNCKPTVSEFLDSKKEVCT